MTSYSLTTGNDTVVGTSGDDTVSGTAATLNAGDSLTGGDGLDVFAYVATSGFTGIDSFTYGTLDGSGADAAGARIYIAPVISGAATTLNLVALTPEEQIASTRRSRPGGLTPFGASEAETMRQTLSNHHAGNHRLPSRPVHFVSSLARHEWRGNPSAWQSNIEALIPI